MSKNKGASIVVYERAANIVLCVETTNSVTCLIMNRRRYSLPILEPNQPGITQFVEREKEKDKHHPIKFISASKSSASRPDSPTNSPSAKSTSKKRTRTVLSRPNSSTERKPNK